MLSGRKVLLGVTGSIAAYKAASLIRLLVKAGAEVRVLMTGAATEFISPLTLSTLSKNPVVLEYTADPKTGEWNNHVALGGWADLMIVAPASANTLAKMANGICDNVLLATYLSAKCPVYFAPAMDLDMYQHPSTKENIQRLLSFGHQLIQPGTGELASGLHGEGRMAEPEEITEAIVAFFSEGLPLAGKKILISAGPTHEPIDPVRFIGNHSSGKMGYAIADEAARLGAKVVLVTGPSALQTEQSGIERIDVVTAEEMYQACLAHFDSSDIGIMAAAVADYRPATVAEEKIKKSGERPHLTLEPTKDILAELGRLKQAHQLLIGFALETEEEEKNARGKLERKNLDFIVLNSLRDKGAGFGHDTNKVKFIDRQNKTEEFELKSKVEVARDILKKAISLI